jgi:hypothetical protein
MRFDDPCFALDVPDSFVRDPTGEDFGAVDEEAGRQIIVSKWRVKDASMPIDFLFDQIERTRRGVLRQSGCNDAPGPVERFDRGDVRVSSFLAVGANPLIAFCGLATHKAEVLGQRWMIAFNFYQYFVPSADAPDVDAFVRDARAIFASLEPLPARDVLARAQGAEIDVSRFYPYLVPTGYLEARRPDAPPPRSFGHGLYVALAEDFEGAARIHFPEDLGELGSRDDLLARATKNLVAAVGDRRVTIQGFGGPRGHVAMLFGPEWLAASCIFLPDLHRFASQHLGDRPICASIPHRDAMLLFRAEDDAYRREMQALIAKNEAESMRKPLTPSLFAVTGAGVSPMPS